MVTLERPTLPLGLPLTLYPATMGPNQGATRQGGPSYVLGAIGGGRASLACLGGWSGSFGLFFGVFGSGVLTTVLASARVAASTAAHAAHTT